MDNALFLCSWFENVLSKIIHSQSYNQICLVLALHHFYNLDHEVKYSQLLFFNSAGWNDDEVFNDHCCCHIVLFNSQQCSHGSKILQAIKVPTPPITEKNKSNTIETDVSSIIVAAPRNLTEN